MTACVGTEVSPSGKRKNCIYWGEYESPGESEFANLCNGGSYEGDRWQTCPSRLECRAATYRRTAREEERHSGGRGLQVLASQNRGFSSRRSLPTRQHETEVVVPTRVVIPTEEHTHLRTPRLEQRHYVPSPVFIPEEGESLGMRIILNLFQAILDTFFQQGKTMTENFNLFPYRRRPPREEINE